MARRWTATPRMRRPGRKHSLQTVDTIPEAGSTADRERGDKLLKELAGLSDECAEGERIAEARAEIFRAIMIGDTPYDIEAASRAGLATIAFRCGGWDDAALDGSIAIYDDPRQLLEGVYKSPLYAETA